MSVNRIIGRYTGDKKGPLLICLGGLHGNEPSGVMAIDLLMKMLEVEPITNPDFNYCGRMLGVRGNLKALERGVRYIDKDLNRSFTKENVARALNGTTDQLDAEDLELREIIQLVKAEIKDYQPDEVYVMDLHTTTAFGGIFSITSDDPKSVELGVELHAPVIKGMANGLHGTTMHYFTTEELGVDTTCVVFESGQHDEGLSVNRAIAAIINCMRTIGAVDGRDVENRHDHLLIEYSSGLPKVAELAFVHYVEEDDGFEMLPDFQNFQRVTEGQIIANDVNGPIRVSDDGLILMPKYQPQSDEGFFIIKPIEGY